MVPLEREKINAADWNVTAEENVKPAAAKDKLGAGDVTKSPRGNPRVMASVPLTMPPTDGVNTMVTGMLVDPAMESDRAIVIMPETILLPIGGLGN